jgi:hypothetical protein
MPRRITLTDRQKDALLRLPISQTDLLRHYTLSDEDLVHIRQRRRPHNRFGFALQLCALRYPGRILAPGELIPAEIVEFIGAQLGLHADALGDYATREETRHEHLSELRALYGFRTFSGRAAGTVRGKSACCWRGGWLAGPDEPRPNFSILQDEPRDHPPRGDDVRPLSALSPERRRPAA